MWQLHRIHLAGVRQFYLLLWLGKDLATVFVSLFLSAPLSPICSLSEHNHGDEADERGGIGQGDVEPGLS